MTPLTPQGPGGPDMWNHILAVVGRMVLDFVLWLEQAIPLMLPAGLAAYLFGKSHGYKGAALRLYVMTGIFVAVVGTPAALHLLGLDIELWQGAVCCGLSVFCYHLVKWGEAWIRTRLGIERRDRAHHSEDEEGE